MPGSADANVLDECPIDEASFARLVKLSPAAGLDMVRALPEDIRAGLAVFCYRRTHLRRLGLTLAGSCSKKALVRESGHAGELIHMQAQNLEATLSGDRYLAPRFVRKSVTLAG